MAGTVVFFAAIFFGVSNAFVRPKTGARCSCRLSRRPFSDTSRSRWIASCGTRTWVRSRFTRRDRDAPPEPRTSTTPALAQKKDKAESATFVTVNGKAVPKVRADALLAGQAAQGQPDAPELRKAVTEELVRREILTQESVTKGFDKKPEVQGQVDLARQGVLIGAYLNDYVKTHPVTGLIVGGLYVAAPSRRHAHLQMPRRLRWWAAATARRPYTLQAAISHRR